MDRRRERPGAARARPRRRRGGVRQGLRARERGGGVTTSPPGASRRRTPSGPARADVIRLAASRPAPAYAMKKSAESATSGAQSLRCSATRAGGCALQFVEQSLDAVAGHARVEPDDHRTAPEEARRARPIRVDVGGAGEAEDVDPIARPRVPARTTSGRARPRPAPNTCGRRHSATGTRSDPSARARSARRTPSARPASGTDSRARRQSRRRATGRRRAPARARRSGRAAARHASTEAHPAASASAGLACTKYCGRPRLPLTAIDRHAAATQIGATSRSRFAGRQQDQHQAAGAAHGPERVDPCAVDRERHAGTTAPRRARRRSRRNTGRCRRWWRRRGRAARHPREDRQHDHDRDGEPRGDRARRPARRSAGTATRSRVPAAAKIPALYLKTKAMPKRAPAPTALHRLDPRTAVEEHQEAGGHRDGNERLALGAQPDAAESGERRVGEQQEDQAAGGAARRRSERAVQA